MEQPELETLEVSHQDQVWVADITYVRLKGRFIYVCLLMDVFTRMIQVLSDPSALEPISDAQTSQSGRVAESEWGSIRGSATQNWF